MKGKKVQVS